MIELKDKLTFGAVAGMIANIFKNAFIFGLYFFDVIKYTTWHMASSSYISKDRINTLGSLIPGAVTDYFMASIMGIIIMYLLYFTGKENYIFKGVMVGLFYWVAIYGIVMSLEITYINPDDLITNLSQIVAHLIIGSLTAFIIVKYGSGLLEE
ncbi:hypothetical protein MWH28_08750 [Natroniella sulfidigena]|uniref:hypothetical protein n=1 Tax=Natroniella sulfidigena TaxID=723921 RepID=UPI00200A6F8A|nr:hypothetical protein [Natroniella sulfidigena]MCK8817446.1 hypothetical protein [Natroniella sulfidigena]